MSVTVNEKGTITEQVEETKSKEKLEDSEFRPVNRDSEWQFKEVVEKNIEEMLNSPSTPMELKRQIIEAQERKDRSVYGSSWPKLSIKDDPQRAATSLVDGGAFYTLLYQLPVLNLKFRAKKSGKQDKFERARRVQEYLQTLQKAGFLRGPKINPTSYSERLEEKLSVEPYIVHDRLTDLLRNGNNRESLRVKMRKKDKVFLAIVTPLIIGLAFVVDHLSTKLAYLPSSVYYTDVTGDSLKDIVVQSAAQTMIFVAHESKSDYSDKKEIYFNRFGYEISSQRVWLEYDFEQLDSRLKAQYKAKRDSLETSIQETRKRAEELR